jgi:phosphonate metabolism-associated iron-containing alcohol dehydrogenase
VIDRIEPNPDVANLTSMYEAFWREHAGVEAVVAVGGGSAMDTAKALMVGTASGRFDELVALLAKGGAFEPHRVKALVAVPTTAGTGSEVTPWATIWDKAAGKKHSLHLPQTWPEAAIVDAELMLTLPASVTVQSGLDALSHALESIWNVNANPISDTYAVAAAREVMATLPALLRDLGNRELRGRMALAALKAGMAFSNTKTALAHSISYEMTLRFGLPHGIACSFTLPMVLDRAVGTDPGRDAVLGQIFDGELRDAPARLREFLRAVGVKTEFADYGVPEDDSRRMVAHALEGVRGKNFIGTRT